MQNALGFASSLSPPLPEVLTGAEEYYHNLSRYCGIPAGLRDEPYDRAIVKILRHIEKAYPAEPKDGVLGNTYFLYCVGQWRKYKAAYSFSADLLRALSDTEEAPVYREILQRLPFPALFVYAPDNAGNVGFFVAVETPEETSDTLVVCTRVSVDEELFIRNQGCALWFKDGQTITDALFADAESTEKYGGADKLGVYRELITPALMTAYYLCSENAVLRQVKTAKGKRPKLGNGKPLNIRRWDVSYREGSEFHRMYEEHDESGESRRNRVNGVRPHVRRAHWHHYWVGKGREKLAVRWIAPVFVMGAQRNVPAVNHEIRNSK